MKQVTVTYPNIYLREGNKETVYRAGEVMRGYLHGPTKAKPSALIVEDQDGYVHVVASSITKEGWE